MPRLPMSLSGLSIRAKLFSVVVVATIPTAVLLLALLRHQNQDISIAQQEQAGARYVVALQRLQVHAGSHRDAAAAFLGGDIQAQDRLNRETGEVDNALRLAADAEKKVGRSFKTGPMLNQIRQDWDGIKTRGNNVTAKQSLDDHAKLIVGDLVPLIYQVGARSKLLLDPEANGYHLAVSISAYVPLVADALSQLQAEVARLVSAGGQGGAALTLASEDRVRLYALLGDLSVNEESTQRELKAAGAADRAIAQKLSAQAAAAEVSTATYVASLETNILKTATLGGDAAAMHAQADAAITGYTDLTVNATQTLNRVLQQRVDQNDSGRLLSFVVTGLGLGLAALLILVVVQNVTGRLVHLASVADRISLGELEAEIDTRGSDEVSRLAAAFQRMQASLTAAIERLRARRAS